MTPKDVSLRRSRRDVSVDRRALSTVSALAFREKPRLKEVIPLGVVLCDIPWSMAYDNDGKYVNIDYYWLHQEAVRHRYGCAKRSPQFEEK